MDGNSHDSADARRRYAAIWDVLRAAAGRATEPLAAPGPSDASTFDAAATDVDVLRAAGAPVLRRSPGGGWRPDPGLGAPWRDLVDLYLPLCQPVVGSPMVIGHLGQSLDGCIATRTGDSRFVNGRQNLVHLHRMRALCDAVVVGAGTVANDDPRLTTRLVPGPHPLRVVLDPSRRLGAHHRIFTDAAAKTLLCCAPGRRAGEPAGQADMLELPRRGDRLDLHALVDSLAARGVRRLFVEGGGVTVSDFLSQGVLNRLQIAVAPLIIGRGRTGVSLAPCDVLANALRPPCRLYRMGPDVLYDFDLISAGDGESAGKWFDDAGSVGDAAPSGADADWPLRIG